MACCLEWVELEPVYSYEGEILFPCKQNKRESPQILLGCYLSELQKMLDSDFYIGVNEHRGK